ncbi:MAG: peptidoglycan DD-metalloendopeptidase family protein [Candidatus Ratteibacteria bacterium]|nr:peptidoglycan DD-metalloendopeptidase family protein [Candidatus Ratteibacteria bacterium]
MPFVLIKIKHTDICLFKPHYQIIEGYISDGDLLGDILLANGLTTDNIAGITEELKNVFDVRRCNIGDRWEIYLTREGQFAKFIYYNGPIDFYIVEYSPDSNTYTATAKQIDVEKKMCGASGQIASSLYESMTPLCISPELIIQFAEIFASKMDFFTDCQTGDTFTLLWDAYVDKKGNSLKDVRIVAASYSSAGKTYYAFYFEPPLGQGCYYDEDGKSVETAFLKAPLNYRRISSYFTHSRLHPIYKVYRPHLGIDYAAPKGTPISAIGDGTVEYVGWRKGLGKTIIIKHPNNYTSWYGHLSEIAKGVTSKRKVRKGQVIGYVGSTGVATGPHLDFRVQKGGKFINFLAMKMPPSYPLSERYIPEFNSMKDILKSRMEALKGEQKIVVFKEPEE